jgi:hypothetical protein
MSLQRPTRGALRARRGLKQRLLETLEPRHLMAGDFRSLDGTGNNLAHTEWGSTNEQFLRLSPAEYGDGISLPAGTDRPSAREISNELAAHPDGSLLNDRDMSALIYAWGQFVDHDIDLTNSATPAESFPIAVPTGDAYFDPTGSGTATIGLTRSIYDTATGTSAANVRQQMNAISAFIDASMVYGSDAATAASLRTMSGGLLKTSAGNLLPVDSAGNFLAGDVRVNENPDLVALQTLFVREHNRLATKMAADHADWNDERLYQEARKVVAGEVQAITYNEFLPALLGQNAIAPYRGYKANVNPGIANEFATAAFRLGHSLLGSDIEFLDNQGHEVHDEVELRDAFFNPSIVKETGIDPILKYLASDKAEELDTRVIDDVRNFLFGPPGAGGFDLASLNIQRGRDHGLADYNQVRAAYGLPKVKDFSDITKNVETQNSLRELYGSVDNIDLWVGGLAEDHVLGASVGPLFQRILADQFTRLRDGDRFWYERDLSGAQLDGVRHTTLADVIRRNSMTTNLQDNVFFFRPTISGSVFADQNSNAKLDLRETGLAGLTVQVLSAEGTVVGTAKTQKNGRFEIEVEELGDYSLNVVELRGLSITTPTTAHVTQGGKLEQNIGLGQGSHASPGTPTIPRTPAPPPPRQQPTSAGGANTATPPAPPPPPRVLDPQMVDMLLGGSTSNSSPRPRR